MTIAGFGSLPGAYTVSRHRKVRLPSLFPSSQPLSIPPLALSPPILTATMDVSRYPDENEYSKYLSAHGGSSNAFTDFEDTNYFFDVNHEHLEGALDRFAQLCRARSGPAQRTTGFSRSTLQCECDASCGIGKANL